MPSQLIIRATTLILVCAFSVYVSLASDWPMFRGPGGRSIADANDLPLEWSVSESKNIAWQADLPGRGVSSPIAVGNRLFVTASSGPNRNRLHILAFNTDTGEKLWHRQFWATGRTLCHETSAVAAPTPASDGKRVFAYFSSNDLIALDLEGNLQWMRGLALDFPGSGNDVGLSSSPVIVDNTVIIQCEAQGNSFVTAINATDGSERWNLQRPEAPNWTSPIAMPTNTGSKQVQSIVIQSSSTLSAHHLDTGKELWSLPLDCSSIPSPVYNELLYVAADGLRALDVSSQTTGENLVWQESKLTPGSSSPVVNEGEIYVINRAGVLTCGYLASKSILWRQRLGGQFWATPVVAGNHIYCFNADGKGFVVQRGEKGKIISENDFGEDILASPAIANNAIFVRSHQHLWKIAK